MNKMLLQFARGIYHIYYYVLQTEQYEKKVRDKPRECHNHKSQPFPDTKRKRKQTKPNKRKLNKRTKSTQISSLSSPIEVIAIVKGLKNTRTK